MPIHYAALGGSLEVTSFLCNNKVNIQDGKDGMTPLFLASGSKNPRLLSILFENGAKINTRLKFSEKSPFMAAIFVKDVESLEILIEQGCNINGANDKELSPLQKAIAVGIDESVELLLENGVDVNYVIPKTGRTPLYYACFRKSFKLVSLLIDYGANVFHRDNFGQTSVHWAAASGEPDILRLILQCGVDPLIPDNIYF